MNQYVSGWAITISIEPTFEIRERCGLSTSTRNMIRKIWPYQLPNMDPETLAKLVFCFENDPERNDSLVSGAQDSIWICVPGLCRHFYDNGFWPKKIETYNNDVVLNWLENHLVMIPMKPRKNDYDALKNKDITTIKIQKLANAANDCWDAILRKDLNAFSKSFKESFDAQVSMFPSMMNDEVNSYINEYSKLDDVLAWKMPGAGGGGYLVCVVDNADKFEEKK